MKFPFLPSAGTSSRLRSTVLLVALAGLTGCQIIPSPAADPTRFYVLTGPAVPAAVDATIGSLTVGLKSIGLAPYLKGRSFVVREGEHELTYNDYARWAEPLDQGISRILQSRLSVAPSVGQVHVQPFPFDRSRDFDVAVSVIRCEGVREGRTFVARFAAVIEVTHGADGTVVLRRTFAAPDQPWDGRDDGALAAALGIAVERLATEVIAMLPTHP